LHIDPVLQHQGVRDQTESAKLVFLALPVPFPDFATLSVADSPRSGMTAFSTVQLR
jgi:hypothetical protein